MDTVIPMKKLPYKIMLDRYSQKALDKKTLNTDTIVVATVDETNPLYPQKEICRVIRDNGDMLDLVNIFDKDDHYTVAKDKVSVPTELSPDMLWERIAAGNSKNESNDRQKWYEEFRWMLEDWRFVPGGRIMAMLGSNNQDNLTGFNCFVIPCPEDSRHGAIEALDRMTEIMARGGGVGINLSTLRPRHAIVRGVHGTSSGAVSWGGGYSYYTGLIEQGGSRRGALLEGLSVWHPDILEFITVKKNSGEMLNANLSVLITEDFMNALQNDEMWTLEFPDTAYEAYSTEWCGNLRDWKSKGYPTIVYKTLPAKDLWNMIIESNWASAEPGVIWIERYNNMSNSWYIEEIVCTNPCITRSDLISTNSGWKSVGDLYDSQESFEIVVDSRLGNLPTYKSTTVFKTGTKDVYTLKTKEGFEVEVTSNHKIRTVSGWKEAGKLSTGEKILIQNVPGCFGSYGTYEEGICLGWLVGDGHIVDSRKIANLEFNKKKRSLVPIFYEALKTIHCLRNSSYSYEPYETTRDVTIIRSQELYKMLSDLGISDTESKYTLPKELLSGSKEFQRGFISAIFSADGCMNRKHAIEMKTSKESLAKGIQKLLLNFNIYSRIYPLIGNVNGKDYQSYEIVISGHSMIRFYKEIKFLQSDKNFQMFNDINSYKRSPVDELFTAEFTELIYKGKEDVFDITVDEVHAFSCNGIIISNCGEQGLPAWGVCNLGHINLSRVPIDPNQRWSIDWNYLEKIIRLGVRFMDNVIDITPYFFEENKRVQMNTRRIGMGTMGLAELLIKLKIRYGSTVSLDLIDTLYAFIRDTAYDESVELAKEKGAFPLFDADKYLSGGFTMNLPENLKEKIRKYGIRNVTLLTQAPTGSTGTMCDTSTGIEPFYDWVYYRRGRLGTEIQYARVIEEYFSNFGVDVREQEWKDSVLPEYFVTAKQLTPDEHVAVMARIQYYTDSSISKTVNCPADWTVEQVDELYRTAYRLGCKGLTIYRDKSRDSQVLESLNDEKSAAPEKIYKWGEVMPKPKDTIYRLVKFNTGCGRIKLMIGTAQSMGNRVVDIYAIVNSEGGCQLNIQGEVIAISKYLRLGGNLDELLENSIKAGNCPSYQFKRGQGNKDLYGKSCFNGVVRAVVDFQNGTLPDIVEVEGPPYEGPNNSFEKAIVVEKPSKTDEETLDPKEDDTCPGCGKKMIKETGCWQCKHCGYSKCE